MMNPTETANVTQHYPKDLVSIIGYTNAWSIKKPVEFTFHIPSNVDVICIRLEGSAVLNSHRFDQSVLIRPGSAYCLGSGSHSMLFGRGSAKVLVLVLPKSLRTGLDILEQRFEGQVLRTLVDLQSGSLANKVNAILDPEERNSFFKYSSLLAGVFDQISEPQNSVAATYRLNSESSPFQEICQSVVNSPQKDWSTTESAASVGYSVFHFSRSFRAHVGIGFSQFVNRVRATQAGILICEKHLATSDALQAVGLNPDNAGSQLFIREFGLTAQEIFRFSRRATDTPNQDFPSGLQLLNEIQSVTALD
jgi:AraC-like DNA-binding protein